MTYELTTKEYNKEAWKTYVNHTPPGVFTKRHLMNLGACSNNKTKPLIRCLYPNFTKMMHKSQEM